MSHSTSRYQRSPAPRTEPIRNKLTSAPTAANLAPGVSETLEGAVDNAYAVYAHYMQRGTAAASQYLQPPNQSNTMQPPPHGPGFDPNASMQNMLPMMPMLQQWMQAMQAWSHLWMGMAGYPQMGFPPGNTTTPAHFGHAQHGQPPQGAQHMPPPAPPPNFDHRTDVSVTVHAERAVEVATHLGPAACGVPLQVEPINIGVGDGVAIAITIQCDHVGRTQLFVRVPKESPAGRYEAPVRNTSGDPVGSVAVVLS